MGANARSMRVLGEIAATCEHERVLEAAADSGDAPTDEIARHAVGNLRSHKLTRSAKNGCCQVQQHAKEAAGSSDQAECSTTAATTTGNNPCHRKHAD